MKQENGNGLFMHFCHSHHATTLMLQEEKQQHQRTEVNFMLMRTSKHQNLQSSQINDLFS